MVLIRNLFSSKKFIAMLCGLIGLAMLKVFKVSVDPQTVAEIVGLVASYILGQSIADQGKAAAQVSAIANFATMPLLNSEQKRAVDAVKSV